MSYWKVTVQEVKDIKPIEGADLIEVATVLGWKLVVKKGEFKVGDRGIYCPIDSQMPLDDDRYSFLDKGSKNRRIKTVKLKGQISQGLLLPFTSLTEDEIRQISEREQGEDVSDVLGVVHYEPPIPVSIAGDTKGAIPGDVKKTDEERIQNIPEVLSLLNEGNTCEVTEKLDGTSMQVYYKDGELNVCSRNWNLKETEGNLLWRIANKLNLRDKLSGYEGFSFQGELVGPGIQGNKYKLKKHEWFVFKVWDIDSQKFLLPVVASSLARILKLNYVPVIEERFGCSSNVGIDELLAYAEGKSTLNKEIEREGLVFTFNSYVNDDLELQSFKVINNKFLLKNKE